MNEFKGTKGKWRVIPDTYPNAHSIVFDNSSFNWIASVHQQFPDVATEEQALANAQLIASAPELLEACMEFVRKCDNGEARSKRSYAQMTAAIAKALEKEATNV